MSMIRIQIGRSMNVVRSKEEHKEDDIGVLESFYGLEQLGIYKRGIVVVEAWLGRGENVMVVVRS